MTTPRAQVRDRSVSRSTRIDASAEEVWALVSDLPGMGRFSPENTGGRWVRGAGPALGSVFRGTNRAGGRRWSTRAEVVAAVPGGAFAFEVTSVGAAVARWGNDITPVEGGCEVTETWTDRRSALTARVGSWVTGTSGRELTVGNGMALTLARIKAHAEA